MDAEHPSQRDSLFAGLLRNRSHEAYARTTARLLEDGAAIVPRLRELLKDVDYDTGHVAEVLGRIGEPSAVPDLCVLMLESKSWPEASDAARALGAIGHPDAIPSLITAIQTRRGWVGENAARSLAEIAERTPDARLQAAFELLWSLSYWPRRTTGEGGVYRAASERIAAALARPRELRPAEIRDLPLPAAAGDRPTSGFPIPAVAADDVGALPVPALRPAGLEDARPSDA